MNRHLRREIVAFLGVSDSTREYPHGLGGFRRRDWESSFNWMNLSGIALPFYNRLQELDAVDIVPPSVSAALAANLFHHRKRVSEMAREFDSLNRHFEFEGIEYAVWKGFSLIPEYCPEACLRPTYDYDYLISEGFIERARGLLQSEGYVYRPENGAEHSLNFARERGSRGVSLPSGGLYSASLSRKVELHVTLWDEDAFGVPLRVPERPLDRRSRRTWAGSCFYGLSEEDSFVFQTLHVFQHILHDWCRLGWLWEIAYFIENRRADARIWNKVRSYLQGNEPLTEVVALVISLAVRLFHATLPEAMKDAVLRASRGRIGLWLEQYGLDSALDNFAENKYGLFLYREFVRNDVAWRQIRRRRLLPLHRPNRVRGAEVSVSSCRLPTSWRQGWYVLQRVVHHTLKGAGYLWESARWGRLCRHLTDGASSVGR
jgi:hypothetical protein